jgi:hypothetical protein
MMDANSACQTLLLIRFGTPGTLDSSLTGRSQSQLEDQLAFVAAALQECGLCKGTRISNEALIGLFPTADSALGVACSVQQACRNRGDGAALADVRILLDRQSGELIVDAAPSPVLAEELLKRVPPGEICATRAVTGQLNELSRARFRLCAQEAADTDAGSPLSQVICNEETITRIAIPTQYQARTGTSWNINLRWRDSILTLTPESPSLTIGRGDQSDIQIESELASRIHARLGFQQTNFILTDQSTNGTFVQIDSDDEVFLHHEQIVLRGSGVISLGRHARAGRGKLIYFKLTSQD